MYLQLGLSNPAKRTRLMTRNRSRALMNLPHIEAKLRSRLSNLIESQLPIAPSTPRPAPNCVASLDASRKLGMVTNKPIFNSKLRLTSLNYGGGNQLHATVFRIATECPELSWTMPWPKLLSSAISGIMEDYCCQI